MSEISENRIVVMMNFPAPPITVEQMDKILSGTPNGNDEHLIRWLEGFFGLPRTSFTVEILQRFREIVTEETFMNVAPAIEKLLKPLRDACMSYCLGLYGGSIALSALAAESLQIILWKMHAVRINGSEISDSQEKTLFGNKFEKLQSSRRIQLLNSMGWITPEQKENLEHIADKRNHYLHSWDKDFSREKEETLECYKRSFKIFREITGVRLKDASSVEANPLLMKWMSANIHI